ncbi:hypothetical protein BU16DRAFT_11024 [Lophium mytilinum]|uniref:SANT domain-containing protein n=1 Tax=Lophium mytilinum TaxID=390894 RepID=A0A6A6RCV5_9PEZI|nr:hypothetical protein BU16DRAFT_11024 [Lophium mytilinum]
MASDESGNDDPDQTNSLISAASSQHSYQDADEADDEGSPPPPQALTAARPDLASRRQQRHQKVSPWVAYRARRSRALKGVYNDDYRIWFNEEVKQAANPCSPEQDVDLPGSQIGVSWWSGEEKDAFFRALSRYGQDNIRAISTAIKSKSEMEVCDYFLLLRDNSIQRQLNAPSLKHAVALRDIPAAIELGEECRKVLDLAGEAVAWYQENFEAKEERKKYGDYWLLDSDLASKIESAVSEQPEGETDDFIKNEGRQPNPDYAEEESKARRESSGSSLLSTIPAARLLKPKNWLALQRNVFMNSRRKRQTDNWRDLAGVDESPSMYYTAFHDFHRMAVSITRRLVQATMFESSSRLRAQDHRNTRPTPKVRRKDVETAIDLLGMPPHSREYWVNVPRRCGIYVFNKSTRFRRPRMKYDDVEKELATPWAITKPIGQLLEITSRGVPSGARTAYKEEIVDEAHENLQNDETHAHEDLQDTQESEEDQSDQGDYETDISSSESHDSVPDDIDVLPIRARRRRRKHQRVEQSQIDEAERVDQQATELEEQRIRGMLSLHNAPDIKSGEEEEAEVPIALVQRTDFSELVNWRSWTEYHAEWEGASDLMEDDPIEYEKRPSKRPRYGSSNDIVSEDSDDFAGVSYPRPEHKVEEDVDLDGRPDVEMHSHESNLEPSDKEQQGNLFKKSDDDTRATPLRDRATLAPRPPRPPRRVPLPKGMDDGTEEVPMDVDSATNAMEEDDSDDNSSSDSNEDMSSEN